METFSSEDLWKAGKSAGRVNHSGSGKYASQCERNEVFYICCTFHVLLMSIFGSQMIDDSMDEDIFQSAIDKFNDRRAQLLPFLSIDVG